MGMMSNGDDVMINSTISAISKTLTQQDLYGEYYQRRKVLGLA